MMSLTDICSVIWPEMEPPSAEPQQQQHHELDNADPDDNSTVEELLRDATSIIHATKNAQNIVNAYQSTGQSNDELNVNHNGYYFYEDLARLERNLNDNYDCADNAIGVNNCAIDNNYNVDLAVNGGISGACNMGSYASKNQSDDQEQGRSNENSTNPDNKPLNELTEQSSNTDRTPSTSPDPSTSPRRRSTTDFQPLGAEISAEMAQQLKKDVRRLSPVHVSQRERTLGEISLISSSNGQLDDIVVGTNDNECATITNACKNNDIGDVNGVVVTKTRLERNNDDNDDNDDASLTSDAIDGACGSNNSYNDNKINSNSNGSSNSCNNNEKSGAGDDIVDGDGMSNNCRNKNASDDKSGVDKSSSSSSSSSSSLSSGMYTGRRELVIRLSRVDCQSPPTLLSLGSSSSTSSTTKTTSRSTTTTTTTTSDEFELLTGVMAESSTSAPSAPTAVLCSSPPPTCPYGTNLILERCNTPGYTEERSLSRMHDLDSPRNNGAILSPDRKTIVEKLNIGNEIEFSSPVASTSRGVHFRTSSPPKLAFDDNEFDANSDSSDMLSMTIAAASGVVISGDVGIGNAAIISRLDGTESFTDDSAESLTLVSRDEVRSDGSDSGLGNEMAAPAPESDSETSFLDRIPDDILLDKDKDFASDVPKAPSLPEKAPSKSSLKRRLTTDCLEDNDEPLSKRPILDEAGNVKKKRNIQFDAVTVYYFPRTQGFTCVPSQGGSTLGMTSTHSHAERFSLTEHAAEQRRLHRARLAQLRQERAATMIANSTEFGASSSEDPSDDTDEEPCDSAEELDIDSYYFLQPVPAWQRRALLRTAGVRRIDTNEKEECKDIRASREHCGCACKGYCDPESCPCSRANVKCQVDRAGFPCGCSRDGCANSTGRIEFNPVRVRTHFIHTLMRLELEKKPHHHRDEEQQHQQHHQQQQQQHHHMHHHHQQHQHHQHHLQQQQQQQHHHQQQQQHHHQQQDSQHHHQQQQHNGRLVGGMTMTDPSADCLGSGFTGLHYDSQDGTTRTESLDLYSMRDDCYPSDDCLGESSNQRKLIHNEFAQSFQHYGTQSFHQNPYTDYQGYQSLPSTSRSPFQSQFQNPGFSPYGSYAQDTNTDSNSTCHQTAHSIIQQQQQQQHNNMYESPFTQDEITGSQYTNLTNSLQPINSLGKLEPFSDMLSARYSYYGDMVDQQQDQHQQQQQLEQANHLEHHHQQHHHHHHHHHHHQQQQQQQQQQQDHQFHHLHEQQQQHHHHHHHHNHHENIYGHANGTAKIDINKNNGLMDATGQTEQLNDNDDCDENFGEIIKKSMVETVSA